MAEVRSTLGDGVALLVDANSCYAPAKAIEVGRMLEAHGVRHYEEPCPYWELSWTREVAEALDLDVAGGEQDWDLPVWRELTETRAVDVVQPDVCYVGGMTRALRVAALAPAPASRVRRTRRISHSSSCSRSIFSARSRMRERTSSSRSSRTSTTPWQAGMYDPWPQVVDGAVSIPAGPGWGVEISDEWLSRSQHRASTLD